MSREKKRGTSGNAKAFITRGAAMKKLQLTLNEFRRLCILKGIYPRNPKKKLEGNDKTYYLRKDIDFLAHERLIGAVRRHNAHKKKVVKARAKNRLDVLKRLALNAPRARLDHLVVERYPRFEDAIRELDDPLCLIALFANLPADRQIGVSPHRITNCQRLFREFCNFVADTRALSKVFVSVKGYYFQATLAGEKVTWITPHRFTQVIPADVDYSVMTTFLELYECVLSFVNFRLYTSRNLAYPPKLNRTANNNALELASLLIEKTPISNPVVGIPGEDAGENDKPAKKLSAKALKEAEQVARSLSKEEQEEDDEEGEDGEANGENGDEKGSGGLWGNSDVPLSDKPMCTIFAGKSFVLGREVPYIELEFVLKSAGAACVTREGNLPDGDDRLEQYTHWIMDRPKIAGSQDMSIEYVQPQYVFDSINAGMMLPASLYGPGTPLPPHLSPFATDADDGGYRPWFQEVVNRIKTGDVSVVGEAAAVVYAEAEAKARRERKAAEEAGDGNSEDGDDASGVGEPTGDEDGGADEDEEDDEIQPKSMDVNGIEGDGAEQSSDAESSEEEDDSEGDEERAAEAEKQKLSKDSREMATLMLSRKKRKLYNKTKTEEKHREAAKEKLMTKRKKLEEEAEKNMDRKTLKKRRLQRLGM